ncbi:MAG TPA: ABC transporter permease [Candidatus Mediterraneibacter ornithocaccae]|uniref:ABC transporter permease n=1 Tax=Mediterraneibacter glycyrrhizinilyticus TaxID=342942 RepID=UPI001F9FCBF1|nr:ABC transporter permease [Mediterraneibacter glycyrrhizinilyticus]MDN0062443.1 ABC transporter permease [Mediterraneibacter glycyrrhizinilyticus]HJA18297.1 ABC transporter permease [Candidatus Mediterraneibacter ornithocaccae]
MKGGFYIRLAKDGILKNKKLYFPYILTCICMIMMFYIIYYLGLSADFAKVRGGDMLQSFLSLGVFVIAIFALIFLYYTNSFLIRRRQKEFGLYNILGMGKRSLVKILVWENILTAVISIAAGLMAGILFSKLAELAALHILGGETGFAIKVDPKTIIVTTALFLVLFLLIMLRMIFYIFRLRPVEMLKSENVGEKPPKANWILAVIGAVLLAGAYYLAVAVIDPASALFMFFIAVIMVIIATYLLFIAGSVAMCKLLQKNKKYYYKTKHFVSLSSMVYRMKRNGAGLASICILSTMVLVTLSSTMCLYAQSEDSIQNRYPHDISMDLTSSDYSETEPYREITAEVLDEYGEKAEDVEQFHMYSVAGFQLRDNLRLSMGGLAETGTGEVESIRSVYMICLDDYNRITGEHRALDEDELFLYPYKTGYDYDTITIGDCGTWQVDLMDEQPFPVGTAQANMMGAFFIVVKDISVVQRIEEYRNTLAEQDESMVPDYISESYGFDLSCGDGKQVEIYNTILERISELTDGEKSISDGTETAVDYPSYYIESKAAGRIDIIAINGGLFFLGVLLGAVFLFGTVLIMYYKQISEGYEDQNRFDILMKVGMTRKEVKQSINSQVLTVFFLPLITAGIHLAFAYPLISKILLLLSATEEKLLILVTVCCYLVFALFYVIVYVITSKGYYTIVSGKENR